MSLAVVTACLAGGASIGFLGGVLGIDDKLRALLSSAVSICGVSAAIAAAGAVQARREQIAYAASIVIVFALPSIFLLPWLADVFGLSDAVAGAWIGGNIDTTAAVAASGAIAGEQALQIATIVKTTQNALIGIVAIALAYYIFPKDEPHPSESFDWLGMFLLSPGLALFLFGVSSIPEKGTVASSRVLVPAVIGVVLMVAFVFHALRTKHPLVDLHLFQRHGDFGRNATRALQGTGSVLPAPAAGYFRRV